MRIRSAASVVRLFSKASLAAAALLRIANTVDCTPGAEAIIPAQVRLRWLWHHALCEGLHSITARAGSKSTVGGVEVIGGGLCTRKTQCHCCGNRSLPKHVIPTDAS